MYKPSKRDGTLNTAQPLRATLAEFRACERVSISDGAPAGSSGVRRPIEPPELDAEMVAAVESELQSSLPDDILAVFAGRCQL